ncbi:UNKNOWN [Stylonychia lemnae]|uniref:Uncharacterized protein n=1 Tax=Stylonychia lemnae TaxID=5949 RepID=A0A078B1B6_STYLE|nr:UNKNOWN [Stylonychia lemnae]|eukprot:CDW87147.1 UNKNOWN [Stylonychia lemnae]
MSVRTYWHAFLSVLDNIKVILQTNHYCQCVQFGDSEFEHILDKPLIFDADGYIYYQEDLVHEHSHFTIKSIGEHYLEQHKQIQSGPIIESPQTAKNLHQHIQKIIHPKLNEQEHQQTNTPNIDKILKKNLSNIPNETLDQLSKTYQVSLDEHNNNSMNISSQTSLLGAKSQSIQFLNQNSNQSVISLGQVNKPPPVQQNHQAGIKQTKNQQNSIIENNQISSRTPYFSSDSSKDKSPMKIKHNNILSCLSPTQRFKVQPEAMNELKSYANCKSIQEIEIRVKEWKKVWNSDVNLRELSKYEFIFECAQHENCVFSFKYFYMPSEKSFKFRVNRGYHSQAKVKLDYSRDYQYNVRTLAKNERVRSPVGSPFDKISTNKFDNRKSVQKMIASSRADLLDQYLYEDDNKSTNPNDPSFLAQNQESHQN